MIIFDLECDGLKLDEITEIHCICAYHTEEKRMYTFAGNWDEIRKGVQFLLCGNETLVGHNLIAFDFEVIKKFFPSFECKNVIDTLVLARMFEPDRPKHSLESYAKQFGMEKVKNEKWDVATEVIIERCKSDVEITTKLYEYLAKKELYSCEPCRKEQSNASSSVQRLGSPSWDDAIRLEQDVARIIAQQARTGWKFDTEKANNLITRLNNRIAEIDKEVEPLLKKKVVHVSTVNKPFKKDGSIAQIVHRYVKLGWGTEADINPLSWFGVVVEAGLQHRCFHYSAISGAFSVIDFKPLNLNSAPQMKGLLLSLGWKPTKWNYKKDKKKRYVLDLQGKRIKTSPKLTEDSFDSLPPGLGRILAERCKGTHRRNQTQGLVERVRVDGRIEAVANPCGTNCVTSDTLIVSDTGLVEIGRLQKGDQVLTHDGQYHKVTDFVNNGIQPIVEIVTKAGSRVKCTVNHPFMTPSGWVDALNLVVGSLVKKYYDVEEWRLVPLFTHLYVSSLGRLIDCDGQRRIFDAKERRLCLWKRGRTEFIDHNGRRRNVSVGYLVLSTFVGKRPKGLQVCHRDGNPTNNTLNNLYYGTDWQNKQDMKIHGRHIIVHRNRANSKMTQEKVDEMKAVLDKDGYYRGFDTFWARKFNVSRRLISAIREKQRWAIPTYEIRNKYFESFHYDEVVQVNKLPSEPTYDITVDDAHSYVANGFITHNTARMKQNGVVNIPKADPTVFVGREMRELFICDKDRVLVGGDASSLEWRVASHYINSQIVIDLITKGDIHQYIADLTGLSRNIAKGIGFGFLFGAGVARIMTMAMCSKREAERIMNTILNKLPGLKVFLDNVKSAAARGWLKSIDGRKLFVRSLHSAPNLLIQSAGSIVIKHALVILDREITERKYDAKLVGTFHDEFIFDCEINIAAPLTELLKNAIVRAGEVLKLRCPMDAQARIGMNWAEIH